MSREDRHETILNLLNQIAKAPKQENAIKAITEFPEETKDYFLENKATIEQILIEQTYSLPRWYWAGEYHNNSIQGTGQDTFIEYTLAQAEKLEEAYQKIENDPSAEVSMVKIDGERFVDFSRWKEWKVLNQRRFDDPNKRRIVTRRLVPFTRKDLLTLLELAKSQNRESDISILQKQIDSIPAPESEEIDKDRKRSASNALDDERGKKFKEEEQSSTTVPIDDSAKEKQSDYRVYIDNEIPYHAMMVRCDIPTNKNEFYLVQLLEAKDETQVPKAENFLILRRWGRIGTIGQSTLSPVKTGSVFDLPSKSAKREFEKIIEELTGLKFPLELISQIAPEMYYPVRLNPTTRVSSVLMPLGPLSSETLDEALKIVNNLKMLLVNSLKEDKLPSQEEVVKLSNFFYCLVPHDFEDLAPILLDNAHRINKKQLLVEELIKLFQSV